MYNSSSTLEADIKLDIKREIDPDYSIVEISMLDDDPDDDVSETSDIFLNTKFTKRSPKKSKSPKSLSNYETGQKRSYRRKKNLDEGLIVVEVDGAKIYQCEVCKKLCKNRYKLKTHREIHTTERTVRFVFQIQAPS